MKAGQTNFNVGEKIIISGIIGEDSDLNGLTGEVTHPFAFGATGKNWVGIRLDKDGIRKGNNINLKVNEIKLQESDVKEAIKNEIIIAAQIEQEAECALEKLKSFEDNLSVKGPDAGLSGLKFEPTTIKDGIRAKSEEFGLTFDVSKKSSNEWLVFVFDDTNTSLSYYDGKASSQDRAMQQAGIFMQSLKEHQFLKEIGLEGEGVSVNAYNTLRYDISKDIVSVEQKLKDLGYNKSNMEFAHGNTYVVDRVNNDLHPDFGKPFIQWEMQKTPVIFEQAIAGIENKLEVAAMSVEERGDAMKALADRDTSLDVKLG